MSPPALTRIAVAVSALFGLAQFVCGQEKVENGTSQDGWKRWSELLPAADRAKFKAVHALAMKDPAVRAADEKRKQAEKEFHDVLRARMLKIDPTVRPILDEMLEAKKHRHRR